MIHWVGKRELMMKEKKRDVDRQTDGTVSNVSFSFSNWVINIKLPAPDIKLARTIFFALPRRLHLLEILLSFFFFFILSFFNEIILSLVTNIKIQFSSIIKVKDFQNITNLLSRLCCFRSRTKKNKKIKKRSALMNYWKSRKRSSIRETT